MNVAFQRRRGGAPGFAGRTGARAALPGLSASLAVAGILLSAALSSGAPSDSPDREGPDGKKPPKGSKEGPGGPPRGHGGRGGFEKDAPFGGLSEEEKQRIREVLAKVWQDPAVMAVKESVRRSTDEYRKVLKDAVTREDPEAAALMNKFYEGSQSAEMRRRFEEHMGRGGGRPGGTGRGHGGMRPGGGDGMSDLPEFIRALDDEQKKIYFEARQKAEASEKMAGLQKEMAVLEKKERSSREERFKFMMRMRRAIREEMIRIDPRVAEMMPEAPKSRPGKGERPERPKADGDRKSGPSEGR